MEPIIPFNCRSLLAGDSERPHTAFDLISVIGCILTDSTGTEACGYFRSIPVGTGVPACPVSVISPIRIFIG